MLRPDSCSCRRVTFHRTWQELCPELLLTVSGSNTRELQQQAASGGLEDTALDMRPHAPRLSVGQRIDVGPLSASSSEDALWLCSIEHIVSKAVDKALLFARAVASDGWIMSTSHDRQLRARLQWLTFGYSERRRQPQPLSSTSLQHAHQGQAAE